MKFKAFILAMLLMIPSTRVFAAALDGLTIDVPQSVAVYVDHDDYDDDDRYDDHDDDDRYDDHDDDHDDDD